LADKLEGLAAEGVFVPGADNEKFRGDGPPLDFKGNLEGDVDPFAAGEGGDERDDGDRVSGGGGDGRKGESVGDDGDGIAEKGGIGATGGFGKEDDGTTGFPDTGEVVTAAGGTVPRLVDGDGQGAAGQAGGEEGIGEMGGEGMNVQDAGAFAEKGGQPANKGETGPDDGANRGKEGGTGSRVEGDDLKGNMVSAGTGFETARTGEEEEGVRGGRVDKTEVVKGAERGAGEIVPGRKGIEAGNVHGAFSEGVGSG